MHSCLPCETTENMEHILTTCRAGHAMTVWALAKKLWPYKANLWPTINLGTNMGCGCLMVKKTNQDQPNQGNSHRGPVSTGGASRHLQINVSEVVHLIWVLHCK
ncbi:hypothetical protein V8E53_013386 [Lactarius tabidus]